MYTQKKSINLKIFDFFLYNACRTLQHMFTIAFLHNIIIDFVEFNSQMFWYRLIILIISKRRYFYET